MISKARKAAYDRIYRGILKPVEQQTVRQPRVGRATKVPKEIK